MLLQGPKTGRELVNRERAEKYNQHGFLRRLSLGRRRARRTSRLLLVNRACFAGVLLLSLGENDAWQ